MIHRARPARRADTLHLAAPSRPDAPLADAIRAATRGSVVVERELGGGGMSRLFVGRRDARRVVVKVLVRGVASPLAERRFRAEAELGQRLRHPHLLPVLDAGETDALLFLVLPYADGGTLRRRVRGAGPRPVAEVVRTLRPLADALAHLHAAGVVHGDVKPENVLLHDGRPVLADLGAARAIPQAHAAAADAAAPMPVVGTPLYMAPEQATGVAPADPRADLYSLAVLGWELLAGAAPYRAASPADVLRAHRQHPVPCILERRRDVPPALARLLERALAKDPDERPATAIEFRDVLDRVARTIRIRPATPRADRARRAIASAPFRGRAIAAGLLVPLLASLAAAALAAASFGGALGSVHRALAAASSGDARDAARGDAAVERAGDVRVERATADAPRMPDAPAVARLAWVPRAAHVLPTMRTTPHAAAGSAPLPSVFGHLAPPTLLPLRANGALGARRASRAIGTIGAIDAIDAIGATGASPAPRTWIAPRVGLAAVMPRGVAARCDGSA